MSVQAGRRHFLLGAGVTSAATLIGGSGASAIDKAAGALGDSAPFTVEPVPPAIGYPDGIAKLATVDLLYWDTGGPADRALILCHPATGSAEIWGYQAAVFAAAGYRVIGYSRRGYAGSSNGDAARIGTAVDDLRMLLDHLKVARCSVLGTAAGAFVASSFALTYPDRVDAVILACSLLSPSDETIGSLANSLRGPWYEGLPHDVRELSPSYRMLNKPGLALWKEINHRSRDTNAPINQPIGKSANLAALAQLTKPVLLVAGDADLISPPPIARIVHRAMPTSELVVIPECGHSAYWERPALFNAATLDFLKRQAGRKS